MINMTDMGKYYSRAKKRKFMPQNPNKFVGDPGRCKADSSIEESWFLWFDQEPAVLEWAIEPFSIKYTFDGKERDYYFDALATMRNRDKSQSTYVIEVKPSNKLLPPTARKRKSKNFVMEVMEYRRNYAKWRYARIWAQNQGFVFGIATEKNEFITGDTLEKYFLIYNRWEKAINEY